MENPMSRKNALCALVVVLLIVAATASHAARKAGVVATPSVNNGDPPPGNAMALSVPQARDMLKMAIRKKYAGNAVRCWNGFCPHVMFSEATSVHVRTAGFDFLSPWTFQAYGPDSPSRDEHGEGMSVNFANFKNQEYIQVIPISSVYPKASWKTYLYNVGYLPDPARFAMQPVILAWSDAATAQAFADAFNRLLYAASHRDSTKELVTFSAAAKAWRENPAKPPLSPEAERQRILAENAIKEKNLDSAVEHFESALEVQPMWPEGWFNLAIIYAEQNNYADATDGMKHYLELVPDAPDAKDAREQMIIWEDKAKHGT
jgi:tetratricopeptide (TPR) repeat protein